MDRKTLGAIAIGIIVLMLIVFVQAIFFGGLDPEVAQAYESELKSIQAAEKAVDKDAELISETMAKDQGLRGIGEAERWNELIAESRGLLQEARTRLEGTAKPLLDANKADDSPALAALVSEVTTARQQTESALSRVRERAKRLDDFVSNRERYLKNAATDADMVAKFDLAPTESKAKQAQTDWPGKDKDIAERIARLKEVQPAAVALGKSVEDLGQKPLSDVNPTVILTQIEDLRRYREQLPEGARTLETLLDQLYVSYDKILVDMEIREAEEVTFYHEYKTLKVDRADKPTEEKSWVKVTKATYEKFKKNLGMTIESKPKGVYDHEASKIASPPGYSYVGNKHYGRWDNRNGTRFWVWYGQYSFMRDMFWGPSYGYHPVSYGSWNTYHSYHNSGRSYYGETRNGRPQYGSNGSYTQSRYQSSKYVKSGGYKNSQYAKSGGKYRGTKYSSSRSGSSSSGSYRRGSRSGGGSRSSGK